MLREAFVMFLIARETIYLAKIRKAYLLSSWNASRISQRTVLFTNVPNNLLSHDRLRAMFRGVSYIWLVTDTSELEDDVNELNEAALKLEDGELKMIQQAQKDGRVNNSKRPTSKLKLLVGEKVDTIDHNRRCLSHLLPKVQKAQQSHMQGRGDLNGAVFIEFDTLADAQTAQALAIYDKPASFVSRQMGVLPNEIIWKSLKMNAWNRYARRIIATALITLLILFWSIPVALVGIISNVNYLTANIPFLAWIDNIPSIILGVITGLLPTILLAALMALVPIICRLFAKFSGAVTLSEVELQTQTWYFAFQVIQVFLITTFTSGAAAVASQIVSNPAQAVPLLSKNLPKASNFYISYFILYGVAQSALYLLQPMGLVTVFILSKFAKTPRKKYEKYMQLAAPAWGSEYPKWTNLGVIAISYAVISPLVLGFSTVGLGLIYLAYRYNMLYVHNTQIDTKGACYGRALQQLLVGVYLAEICLLGLFGIGIGSSVSAVGPVVLQVILIIATIAFHITLRSKLGPLLEVLPMNLLTESEKHKDNDNSVAERGHASMNGNGHTSNKSREIKMEGNEGLVSSPQKPNTTTNDLAPSSQTTPPRQSLFKRLFTPHRQSAAALSASLGPAFRHPVQPYSDTDAKEAFLHPAISQQPPVIWLARDDVGVSGKEVSELREQLGRYGVVVSDEEAVMDGKGKVHWVGESVRNAPIWQGRVVY
jgi:hypothetical protein